MHRKITLSYMQADTTIVSYFSDNQFQIDENFRKIQHNECKNAIISHKKFILS